MQLQVVGCRNTLQTPETDTIVFDYVFKELRWYAVTVTLDVSSSGDGVARLYVDGSAVVRSGNVMSCTKVPPEGEGPLSPSFQSLSLAPASIGAWDSGTGVKLVFDGFLDEVTIFDYALSGLDVAQIQSLSGQPDRLLPNSGFAAIMAASANCASAAELPSSALLLWEAADVARPDALQVVTGMDYAAGLEPGIYQLCFTKSAPGLAASRASWVPSGVAVTVQSSVLGLSVNGVSHRGGIVNYMPATLSNVIQIMRRATTPGTPHYTSGSNIGARGGSPNSEYMP